MAEDMNQGNAPQNSQYVAFNLRDEEYGVSILNVQEIRNLTDITRVPFAADFIKGVINLRGSVLPVIDLKQRLEVLSLENAPVDTKKATNGRESSRFLSGIGNINGRLIVLLNLEEIVGLPKEAK